MTPTPQKYELLKNDTKRIGDKTLYRVKYLKSFALIAKGELGGYIEKEANLSQVGDAQVSGDARVSGNALVCGNARVSGDARVYGNAQVSGNARVSGRFDLTIYCDVEIPRVLIDTKEKLAKLLEVMNELKA
jgi:hypothetical protein